MRSASLTDEALMRLALDEARVAADAGELPIGAVVVAANGDLIAREHNRRVASTDPTAHAEVLALRSAAQAIGNWRLEGCTLVVTLEPCPMCAGAVVMSRLARVVFGAWNDDYGAVGSRWDLVRDRRLPHRAEVTAGVMEAECGAIVRAFFAQRRVPPI